MIKKSIAGIAAAAICLGGSAAASASVTVAGTGEPPFTRSENNTQWVEWSTSGWDSYALRVTYIRDGVQVAQHTVPVAQQGKTWINWGGVVPLPLEQGRTYAICVQGRATIDGLPLNDGPDSCTSGANAGKRSSTTIDRSKPEISVELAGGAATAPAGTSVPLAINYADTHSQPFPANFLCVGTGPDRDTPCGEGDIYGFSQQCSIPARGALTTSFECALDTSATDPDEGLFWACIASADSSVPDNPSSADQTGPANTANISEKTCDSIDLINAACKKAKAQHARAKARLARLKRDGAEKPEINRAQTRVRDARAAVRSACA